MIFTIMTYARLDSFRAMTGLENEFTRYMETMERTYVNMAADRFYDKTTFSKPKSNDTGKDETPKGKSSGRLSLYPLIDSKIKETNPRKYEETISLLKKLIEALYGDQKHFKEILHKRPGIIEQLIEHISEAAKDLPKEKKIKKPIDLSNLKLGDNLEEFFYLMLKGCPSLVNPPQIPSGDDETDEGGEEFTSDKAYDSLLNFIDLHKNMKINIYIASKPLLKALYENDSTVDKLLHTRAELYKLVKKKNMEADEASEKLKTEFELNDDAGMFEYKVTGSDPEKYN